MSTRPVFESDINMPFFDPTGVSLRRDSDEVDSVQQDSSPLLRHLCYLHIQWLRRFRYPPNWKTPVP